VIVFLTSVLVAEMALSAGESSPATAIAHARQGVTVFVAVISWLGFATVIDRRYMGLINQLG
jgi:hypothetical protein